jgi:D-arabinose 1-dehydrogenase-like Zn-dependent alcohol dehydrogenase
MATKYKAFQFAEAKANLTAVERKIEEPAAGQVRINVKACGLCHSDSMCQGGFAKSYPRVPGHEIAGVVDAVGSGVTRFKTGDHVGVGWHGKHCYECRPCRQGDFICCDKLQITALHFDGGYQEYVNVPAEAVASIPEGMDFKEAAPLMCAGVTVYNSLRHTKALAGDVVAIQGTGGLGHLGIQFANKMGFRTVAISRGQEKKEEALKLGAHVYIDTNTQDAAKELQALGGAKVILSTVVNPEAMGSMVPCLGKNGTLVVIGVGEGNLAASPVLLVTNKLNIQGWASGTPQDSEDTMNFAALSGVKSLNEVFPVSKIHEAYERMMSGKAHFRVVVDWEAK